MSKEKRSRLFELHSFVGLFLALILYAVCFTGTFSLFHGELTFWQNPQAPVSYSGTPAPIDNSYDEFMSAIPETSALPIVVITYPTKHSPVYELEAYELVDGKGPPVLRANHYSALNGQEVEGFGTNLTQWMATFHSDLWLPAPYGRSVMGILGFLLLIMVMSGIFMHKSPIKMSFLWRPGKSLKVLLLDSHTVFGVWGLIFHAVMAFTGSVIGLLAVLGIIYGFTVTESGQPIHLEPFSDPYVEGEGKHAPTISPDTVRQITEEATGTQPSIALLFNKGKDTAVYRIYYEIEKPMARFGLLDIKGATGEVIANNPTPQEFVKRMFITIMPLHTGAYGGIWVKILYGLLGTSLCLIMITGIMMWLDRNKDSRAHNTLERLTVGMSLGLPIATIVSIYVDQTMTVAADTRAFWIGTSVFSLWALATLVALVAKNTSTALRYLLVTLAVSLAGLPIFHIISRWGTSIDVFGKGAISPTVANIVFLLLSVLTVLAARKIRAYQSA